MRLKCDDSPLGDAHCVQTPAQQITYWINTHVSVHEPILLPVLQRMSFLFNILTFFSIFFITSSEFRLNLNNDFNFNHDPTIITKETTAIDNEPASLNHDSATVHHDLTSTTNELLDLPEFDETLNMSDGVSSRLSCPMSNESYLPQSGSMRKQSHCAIEKKRRDRLNDYIVELGKLIPSSLRVEQRSNKLSVLKQVVKYIRFLKFGCVESVDSFFVNQIVAEKACLLKLMLNVADSFLLIVNCRSGEIYHVSESVKNILGYSNEELAFQNCFNMVHPKDVPKVKEQLFSTDLTLLEKTSQQLLSSSQRDDHSRLWPGLRREFFCRMKNKSAFDLNRKRAELKYERGRTVNGGFVPNRYMIIHCVGFIFNFYSPLCQFDAAENHLVLLCRPIAKEEKNQKLHFLSRLSVDAKFTFVDHRVAFILGYLPQELIGCSLFDFCKQDDVKLLLNYLRNGNPLLLFTIHFCLCFFSTFSQSHFGSKTALDHPKLNSQCIEYCLKKKSGKMVKLRTNMRLLLNPFTRVFEFLIGVNVFVSFEYLNLQIKERAYCLLFYFISFYFVRSTRCLSYIKHHKRKFIRKQNHDEWWIIDSLVCLDWSSMMICTDRPLADRRLSSRRQSFRTLFRKVKASSRTFRRLRLALPTVRAFRAVRAPCKRCWAIPGSTCGKMVNKIDAFSRK